MADASKNVYGGLHQLNDAAKQAAGERADVAVGMHELNDATEQAAGERETPQVRRVPGASPELET